LYLFLFLFYYYLSGLVCPFSPAHHSPENNPEINLTCIKHSVLFKIELKDFNTD
jgi:hypothetical protein